MLLKGARGPQRTDLFWYVDSSNMALFIHQFKYDLVVKSWIKSVFDKQFNSFQEKLIGLFVLTGERHRNRKCRSWDRLIFIMGIPIMVRRYLYMKTGPRSLLKQCCPIWPSNTYDTKLRGINTLRPRQNGHHFADDIFKFTLLNEYCCVLFGFQFT